jgi:hypothetical protein
MAALDLHDQVFVEMNGLLLSDNTSVTTDLTADDQDVDTTVRGFAGISPSPRKRTVSCENVVPVTTGIEVDIETWFMNATEVTIKLIFGGAGKSCVTKGFLKKVSVSSGVGQTTKVSFDFTGTPSVFS